MLLEKSPAVLAGLFAVLCWACLPVVVKLGLQDIPLTYFLLLRFLISTLVSLVIARVEFTKLKLISRQRWGLFSGLLAANYALQTWALREIPATWYIMIFSLSPLLSLFLSRTKLTQRSLVGVFLALGGTTLFLLSSGKIITPPWGALIALLGGMVTWAVFVSLVRELQIVFKDAQITTLTSALSLLPISILWFAGGAPTAPVSSTGVLALIMVGLFLPAAYWAFLYCLRRMPVFGITSQYLEPAFGVALAWLILGETVTASQVAGGALLATGVSFLRD